MAEMSLKPSSPSEVEALRRAMAGLPSEKETGLLEAAQGVMDFLARWWGVRATSGCERCEYDPDVVSYYVRGFRKLEAAAYGVSASGLSPIGGRSHPDARRKYIAIKADIECASDKALVSGKYLHWHVVRRIYVVQQRQSFYYARLRELVRWEVDHPSVRQIEPGPAVAYGLCYQLIARKLGWEPHECEEAA